MRKGANPGRRTSREKGEETKTCCRRSWCSLPGAQGNKKRRETQRPTRVSPQEKERERKEKRGELKIQDIRISCHEFAQNLFPQNSSKLGSGPNTVSESTVSNTELSEFLGLTEFRGANSVSSSQPIICVPKRTHRVCRRTHRVSRRTQ